MKCRATQKCLLCTHSLVGDKCDGENTFSLSTVRQLEEKLAVYRCKKDFLEQELLRAREKKVIETNKKRLKETIKCVKRLNRMLNEVKPKIEESKSILVKIG